MTSTGHFTQAQLATIDDVLTGVEHREKQRRRMDAEQLTGLAEAMDAVVGEHIPINAARELGYRSLRLELAMVLGQSEHCAEVLLEAAYSAKTHFASTLEALRDGEVTLAHLKVITGEGAPLTAGQTAEDRERLAAFEAQVLEVAREETPSRLRPIARRLAAAHDGATMVERHERAVKCRSIRVIDADDGMADLTAYLPAEEAYAIYHRLTKMAKDTAAIAATAATAALEPDTAGSSAGDPLGLAAVARSERGRDQRSRDEIRADVFRDLLLERPGKLREVASRIQAQIQVVVPGDMVGMHGGDGTEGSVGGAAELIGYGPIDAATAQRLAGDADAWECVTVSIGGEVLTVNRYRPTAEQRRVLSGRDLHCRAMGCRVAAYRCDIDHTVDAAHGGPTSTANLAHLCRGHHMLKHHTDWSVEQEEDGVMKWTSPTGRVYFDKPASRVRFRRVPVAGGASGRSERSGRNERRATQANA